MPDTPEGRYTFPDEGEENWNSEAAGGNPGPEDIWAQQELEIQNVVESFGDLPDADGTQTDDGQRRRFYVRQDKIVVRDTGTGWEIIGGLGSAARPLPTSTFEEIDVEDGGTVDGVDVSAHAADSDAHHAQTHDNADHSEAFVSDGDDVERQIWVIENGASDPAGADPEDIIFEEEA